MAYIYTLSDSSGIRYVGKTNDIKTRFRKHIGESKSLKKNNHRVNWIKSLAERSEKPIIEILDIVPDDCWIFWEIFWISQIKSWGFNLVNGTLGGENPPSFTGRTHSDEYKEIRRKFMLSDKNPSKFITKETKEKISKAQKLKALTESKERKEQRRSRCYPIIQLDLNGVFIKKWDSATDVHNCLGIFGQAIGKCIKGERKKAGGFMWALYIPDSIVE